MVLFTITALIVGFLVGCTSVGGVLLIPALDAASSIGLHRVTGTALFSFLFGGLLGTYLFHKARIIDWAAVKPLCFGAFLTALPGALAKEYVSVPVLASVLAILILLAGISALTPIARENPARKIIGPIDRRILFSLGAAVSFISAMTGAGGPVLSVPLMLIIGYSPLLCVTVAQPLTVVITFMGSVGNVAIGSIDYPLAAIVSVCMLAGIRVGVYAIRFFKPDVLKKIVSLLCIATGILMLIRNIPV